MTQKIHFDEKNLKNLVEKFANTKILVVGDLMWDEYIWGSCSRVSPEAPVPVILANKEERRLGGCGNVLNNLNKLNVQAGVLTIIGDDENGKLLKDFLQPYNLLESELIIDNTRPTTIKTRIVAQNQQLLRLDKELTHSISSELEDKIIKCYQAMIEKFDAVIISDYDKGFFTPKIIKRVIDIANEKNKIVAVDPQVSHFMQYKNITVMTPNEKEASGGCQFALPTSSQQVTDIANKIFEELNCEYLLITRSEKGMALFSQDSDSFFIPTVAHEIYDVSGAGDAVISVFTAALAAHGTVQQAAVLSNIAGGIVVAKVGTAPVLAQELINQIKIFLPKFDQAIEEQL